MYVCFLHKHNDSSSVLSTHHLIFMAGNRETGNPGIDLQMILLKIRTYHIKFDINLATNALPQEIRLFITAVSIFEFHIFKSKNVMGFLKFAGRNSCISRDRCITQIKTNKSSKKNFNYRPQSFELILIRSTVQQNAIDICSSSLPPSKTNKYCSDYKNNVSKCCAIDKFRK